MKQLVKIYELMPRDSHKSFYKKAHVKCYSDGSYVLQSYETDVLRREPWGGRYSRLWDGWTATTGRHIAAFSGLNKREYLTL